MESQADDGIPVCELCVGEASQTKSFFRCSLFLSIFLLPFLPDRRLVDRVMSRVGGVGAKVVPNGKMN